MIQLRALGVLDLRNSEGEELRQVLAQPKRAALLTYLALAARTGPHPRDKLLSVFWPDQDAEHARNALSQAVHFLRRALGDDVVVNNNGDSLAIAQGSIWCDVKAFDEALDDGRTSDAVELYRGDFLDSFHVANAPEFERWLDVERQQLAGRFDTVLETMAMRCEQQGDHASALTHRRRLAARALYNSGIALRLIRALAASGDHASAVQHALVHEKLLRSEFDVALPADITAFVAELQARPPVSRVVPRPVAEPIVETHQRPAATERRSLKTSRRVALLTAALVAVCVGVAAAFVGGSRDSVSDELRSLYLRGRNAGVNRSLVGLQTAEQYHRRAIERDSGFALGYAGLSEVYSHMANYDLAPTDAALDSARILAQRAVALDSTLPETRTALALSLANGGHFGAAEREFRSAIRQGPNYPEARYLYALLLVALGRGNEALAEAERALELDPLAPRAALGAKRMASYLITGQRPYMKLPTAERRPILNIEPGEPWARARQAWELANEGRCGDALSEISRAQRNVPDSNMLMLAFAGSVHWSCDGRAHARALLAQMKRRSDSQDHGLHIAILHTRFGEKDSAFVWLARERWTVGDLATLSAAPFVDPLRSDPRFPQLMRHLGIR